MSTRIFARSIAQRGLRSLGMRNYLLPAFPIAAPYAYGYNMPAMALYSTSTSSPFQTQFWKSLVPKPFRNSSARKKKTVKSKEWNPMTFYICILLLIGSMSIQMIALKNEFNTFTRRADARIGLLREVIKRVQDGEDVDVEGLLGTGNKEKEEEWEQLLQEIEEENSTWEKNEKQKTPEKAQFTAPSEPAPTTKTTPKRSNAPSGFY